MQRMEASGHGREHAVPYEQLREAVINKEFRVEIPTERHIGLEMGVLEPVLKTLVKRNWLVRLAPEGSPGFVTCDHPVCLMFSDPAQRGGFCGPGRGVAGRRRPSFPSAGAWPSSERSK